MKAFIKSKLVLRLIVMILLAGAIAIPLAGKITHSHAQAPVTISEFAVPASNSSPNWITAGPDGDLWFTETNGNNIGRITPSGTITEFAIPTSNSGPQGIIAGPDSNLWFTELGGNNIGRITPSGTITQFPIPTSNSGPYGIAAGLDGNFWFTEFSANKIGRITPSGTITEFPISAPSGSSGPYGITAGSDGNLWFTEYGPNDNQIGRITPSGTITQFPIPTSEPQGIAAGPSGNLWFTDLNNNSIGQITPSGTITEFPIPTSNFGPEGITAGPDGNLWFTGANGNSIGQITPSGTVTQFPVPTSQSVPEQITAGPDGNLWFTEANGNNIGRVNLPPSCSMGSSSSNTQSESTPSAKSCNTTLWGVDSSDKITQPFYNSVFATFGAPALWGRYIGQGRSKDMAVTEASFAHTHSFAILPIYFNYATSAVKGYSTGQNYATLAIKDAQQRLGISQGVAIFVDIEAASKPDAAFIKGWYDRFNSTFTYTINGKKYPPYQAGYYKAGYYANTLTSSHFDGPFCTAASHESVIGTNSFIWTSQPNKATLSSNNPLPIITQKANAPSYSPSTVSCPPRQIPIPDAWQYAINSNSRSDRYKINVDIDEALTSLPLWYPVV